MQVVAQDIFFDMAKNIHKYFEIGTIKDTYFSARIGI